MSDVVAGVDFAATQASKKAAAADSEYAATGSTKHKGSVANMSLGGGKSKALDTAVNQAVDGGLHFAVAAGTLSASTAQILDPDCPPSFQAMITVMLASTRLLLPRRL